MIIDGKELSLKIRKDLSERVAVFPKQFGRVPHLVIVLVGENPASQSYVRIKEKALEEVGIKHTTIALDMSISQDVLLNIIKGLNADVTVDGILVQLPLPKHINQMVVISSIAQEKDVDGFHPLNVSGLWMNQPHTMACTPKGIMHLLDYAGVEIEGKRAVIIGRSQIVGLPIAKMLLDKNATVTICHSHTKDLTSICRTADILIVAIGSPRFVVADMVSEGAVVVDVGINRDPETGGICGDCDFSAIEKKASLITPVPGGVGPMTIACLIENIVDCFIEGRNINS